MRSGREAGHRGIECSQERLEEEAPGAGRHFWQFPQGGRARGGSRHCGSRGGRAFGKRGGSAASPARPYVLCAPAPAPSRAAPAPSRPRPGPPRGGGGLLRTAVAGSRSTSPTTTRSPAMRRSGDDGDEPAEAEPASREEEPAPRGELRAARVSAWRWPAINAQAPSRARGGGCHACSHTPRSAAAFPRPLSPFPRSSPKRPSPASPLPRRRPLPKIDALLRYSRTYASNALGVHLLDERAVCFGELPRLRPGDGWLCWNAEHGGRVAVHEDVLRPGHGFLANPG